MPVMLLIMSIHQVCDIRFFKYITESALSNSLFFVAANLFARVHVMEIIVRMNSHLQIFYMIFSTV